MIAAVLDTNIPVQAAISDRGASHRVIQAAFSREYQPVFSPATLDELHQVLVVPSIRALHAWSDLQIRDYVDLLTAAAAFYAGEEQVAASLTRDATDTKFLALAKEAAAPYLVTNDRRHLLG
jgi:putative PIN family toxin of toxin-antitoxin system